MLQRDRDWYLKCHRDECGHDYGLHAQVGDWCAACGSACAFSSPRITFDFNLATKPRLKDGYYRWPFQCGCRVNYDVGMERLAALRFCQSDDCPAWQYAQEVYDEYLTEQRAYEESEILRLPEELVTKPGTTVGVLGMLAGLIKRGG